MPNIDDDRCQNVIASLRTHTKRKTFLIISNQYATEEVGQIPFIQNVFSVQISSRVWDLNPSYAAMSPANPLFFLSIILSAFSFFSPQQ